MSVCFHFPDLYFSPQFSESWERHQKRTLAPHLDAGGEALVNLFWSSCFRGIDSRISPRKLSMLLRRHEFLSPHFSLCLNFYLCKMEQDRGMRNASYKVMTNTNSSSMQALNSLHAYFREKGPEIRKMIAEALQDSDQKGEHFSPHFIDWFDIARQLPAYHAGYDHGSKKRKDVNRDYAAL